MLPVQWSGTVAKSDMRAGATSLTTTLGFNPKTETATFRWALKSAADAQTLLSTLGPHFNGVYTYTHKVYGSIKVRPTANYSVEEASGSHVFVNVSFERVG